MRRGDWLVSEGEKAWQCYSGRQMWGRDEGGGKGWSEMWTTQWKIWAPQSRASLLTQLDGEMINEAGKGDGGRSPAMKTKLYGQAQVKIIKPHPPLPLPASHPPFLEIPSHCAGSKGIRQGKDLWTMALGNLCHPADTSTMGIESVWQKYPRKNLRCGHSWPWTLIIIISVETTWPPHLVDISWVFLSFLSCKAPSLIDIFFSTQCAWVVVINILKMFLVCLRVKANSRKKTPKETVALVCKRMKEGLCYWVSSNKQEE